MIILVLALFSLMLAGEEGTACGRPHRCRYVTRVFVPCSTLYPSPWAAPYAAAEPLPPGTLATRVFTSPKGNNYLVHITNVREPEEEVGARPVPKTATLERARITDGETFNGSDRRAAKLSIADAANQNFETLDALLATLAADDDVAADPDMSEDPKSQRVPRERRNVTVYARLYASSKESDNDFHCILGGEGPAGNRQYINAEISGLPKPGETFFQQLQTVRQQFKDHFGRQLPGDGYHIWRAGIPVRVSGSLFFDVKHYRDSKQAGTERYKAQTYWEIHPITEILFEP